MTLAKEFSKKFYKSKAWQKCRDGYIASVNGLCEECLKENKITPGYIVHHKVELTPDNINNPDITLNWDNLEYCCQDCHNKITFGEAKVIREGLKFNEFGEVVKDDE